MNRSTRKGALAASALAFATLAGLTATGTLERVDEYALRHLAPGGLPVESEIPVFGPLFQYHGHHFDVSQVVRLPGALAGSLIFLSVALAVLWKRGDRRAVLAWGGSFVAANVVALACKEVLTKPPLYGLWKTQTVQLTEFASSFPSGHAMRIVLLAAVFVYVWRRLLWPLVVWVVAALVSIEVDHLHTLSDIAGGVILACVAILSVSLILDTPRAESLAGRRKSASARNERAIGARG